jgi:hypothetical protein
MQHSAETELPVQAPLRIGGKTMESLVGGGKDQTQAELAEPGV